MRTVRAEAQCWPLREPFVIARGVKTEAEVIVVEVTKGAHTGRGEGVPYTRYGESVAGCLAAIAAIDPAISRLELSNILPAGAARNALDCALWDLEAKQTGRPVGDLAGLPPAKHRSLQTAYTLSLGTPETMAQAALAKPNLTLFKLKLGGRGDDARMAAVRAARPDARLVADANEAWTPDLLVPLLAAAAASEIELIEQPLPAGCDAALASISRPVPVCADESVHVAADVARLAGRYDAVNVKLDKAGGLTGALELTRAARTVGLRIMAGCMVSTSLAMAPAMLIGQLADWVDLDGPLLLARDREPGLAVTSTGYVQVPGRELWG